MERYLSHLKSISDQEERYLGLLGEWIQVNSKSGNESGLMEMHRILESAFRHLGGRTLCSRDQGRERTRPKGESAGALHIIKRADAPLRVLLCGHMDTVLEPGSQGRKSDIPHRLKGIGAADAKGGLLVMLAALECFESSPFAESLGWEVLIVPDEERGSRGSKPLLEKAAGRCQVGLVFEPALPDGSLVGERMGSGTFRITIHGKSAHAGRNPEDGRNAIEAMADAIVSLRELWSERKGILVNVGEIHGGGPVNVVPDEAMCRFNVRVASDEDTQYVLSGLQRIIGDIEGREGFAVELRGGFGRLPKVLDNATLHLLQSIAACGRELGLSLDWRPSGGVCDGNTLAAAGLPNVDTLGPVGDGLHTPDENVVLTSIVERARLVALFLMKISSGVIPWPPA